MNRVNFWCVVGGEGYAGYAGYGRKINMPINGKNNKKEVIAWKKIGAIIMIW